MNARASRPQRPGARQPGERQPVDVVLPCLNEAGALPQVLAELPPGYRPVVVDNGSTDDSPTVARALGATVVHEPSPGYGAAVHTGLLHCATDMVAVIDSDASLDPAELPVLAEVVLTGEADLAVGRRVPEHRGVWPWHARAGNAAIASLLRRRQIPVHDIAPVRVARREQLLALGVTDRAFGYPLELLLRAGREGWRIAEFPVTYRARATGTTSKVSGSLRGTMRAARDFSHALRTAGAR